MTLATVIILTVVAALFPLVVFVLVTV